MMLKPITTERPAQDKIGNGMISGLLVGCAIQALLIYLTGSGVATRVGTVDSNLGDLTNAGQTRTGADPVDAAWQQAQDVDPSWEKQVHG